MPTIARKRVAEELALLRDLHEVIADPRTSARQRIRLREKLLKLEAARQKRKAKRVVEAAGKKRQQYLTQQTVATMQTEPCKPSEPLSDSTFALDATERATERLAEAFESTETGGVEIDISYRPNANNMTWPSEPPADLPRKVRVWRIGDSNFGQSEHGYYGPIDENCEVVGCVPF